MKSNQVGVKLVVAFSLLMAILIGVGFLGLGQMSRMNDQTQDVTDVRWLKVKLAREALHYSDLNNRITMELFLLDDQRQITALLEQRRANTDDISGILKQIESQTTGDAERALLARVEAKRKPYIASYLAALDLLIKQGRPDEAREMMIGQTLPLLVGYHGAWEAFVAYQGRQMDAAGDAVEARYWAARKQVTALIAAAVVFACGIAAVVTRGMMREISSRQRAEQQLRQAHEGLEIRVRERTAELQEAHQRLMESSRLAGMAEVATGVLHNVGNVLNSVNVSANIIAEKVNQSPVANLCKASEMIESHQADLASYLIVDEKGRQLTRYFSLVGRTLSDDNAAVMSELASLSHGIEHIKQIVELQQDYARTSTLRSPVDPASLLEDAVRINMLSLERHGVRLVREVSDVGMAEIDKSKTLQILTNLISNAKNAVRDAAGNDSPTVKLRMSTVDGPGGRWLRYEVIDNGVGIPPENLSRLFNHGFTTRVGGHGFGLHSAANAAREMDGNLTAFSEGAGRGARFTLDIPLLAREAKAA